MQDPIAQQLKRIADALDLQNAANEAWIETQIRWRAEDSARTEALTQQNQEWMDLNKAQQGDLEKTLEMCKQHYNDIATLTAFVTRSPLVPDNALIGKD